MNTVRVLRSPQGWAIVPIHYSFDPDKTAEWAAARRREYPTEADWRREMEIDFSSAAGKPAYPNFRNELHVGATSMIPALPICLCVDFNVAPMIWELAQIQAGKAIFFDEIKLTPATIDAMVQEFRTRHPAHPGGVIVYGDATGSARTTQTAQSDYDLMRLAFRNYPTRVEFRVPPANPAERNRLNAVNRKLLGAESVPGVLVDPACRELIQDFAECVLDKRDQLEKIRAERDPRSQRTHGSDAAGYFIFREWPIVLEVATVHQQKRKPLVYGRVAGDI